MSIIAADNPARSARIARARATYENIAYLGKDLERLHSYRWQLLYVLRSHPKRVLLIGKGDDFVGELLRRARVSVTTLDIDPTLEPDITASVESIPLPADSYDVAICCEVLEHLPFGRFSTCLRELRRVTRSHLVLSVPDIRRFFSFRLSIPKIDIDWQFSMSPERFAGCPHFWEIGFSGTGHRAVRRAVEDAGWNVCESRRVNDLSWHRFFYCQRRRSDGPGNRSK